MEITDAVQHRINTQQLIKLIEGIDICFQMFDRATKIISFLRLFRIAN